jgi:hypothetical protein
MQFWYGITKTCVIDRRKFCCPNISGYDVEPSVWMLELFLNVEYIDRIGLKSVEILKFVIAWNYIVLFDKIHMKTVNCNVSHHKYIIHFCNSVLLRLLWEQRYS